MAFNRQAAVDYAKKWALKTNPDYPREGNDCTSFASQALLAGGWWMVGERSFFNRKGADVWWCGGANFTPWSYTWGGAHNFSLFVSNSGRGRQISDAKHLDFADIVQMKRKDGHVYHTMIVTGISQNDQLLSYHTTDTLDKPLSNIDLPEGNSFIFWKISDTVY